MPYLSFVIVARNDNYGGDFLGRIQAFVDNVGYLGEKTGLDLELVIVEWNPPAEEKFLSEVLVFSPFMKKGGRVQFVTIPAEIHQSFPNADKIPLFEYIAKNVGIRRSTGKFVLTTNPDLLFTEELMEFFSRQNLSNDFFYRANRYDVREIPAELSPLQKLKYCKKNWFQVYFSGSAPVKMSSGSSIKKIIRSVPSIIFGRIQAYIYGRKSATPYSTSVIHKATDLHTRASGDFILMSREHWNNTHGFPELYTYSHIDAYMCGIAAASGLSQAILHYPYTIFHKDHGRDENNNRPMTDLQHFFKVCDDMFAGRRSYVFNDDSWGISNDTRVEEAGLEF